MSRFFPESDFSSPYGSEADADGDGFQSFNRCLAQLKDQIAQFVEISPFCESPIEVQLGGRLAIALQNHAAWLPDGPAFALTKQEQIPLFKTPHLLLIPQFCWSRFRFDFAIQFSWEKQPRLLIECDGRQFHSTPEQIANDRRKDNQAAQAGMRVLRFSGSRIFHAAERCCAEVLGAL